MSATVSPDTTRNLAAYIAGLCGETLPADVDRMARLCLMDWIGCAVAGASLRGSRVIREVLTQSAAAGRSTIVGGDCALDAAAAALHNGYASHALEFDDAFDALQRKRGDRQVL